MFERNSTKRPINSEIYQALQQNFTSLCGDCSLWNLSWLFPKYIQKEKQNTVVFWKNKQTNKNYPNTSPLPFSCTQMHTYSHTFSFCMLKLGWLLWSAVVKYSLPQGTLLSLMSSPLFLAALKMLLCKHIKLGSIHTHITML